MSQQASGDASMLGGHVKYVQGAVSEALGYETGKTTKEEAVQEMRQAKEQSSGEPMKSNVLGEAEAVLGKATGCEGMQDEAQERKV